MSFSLPTFTSVAIRSLNVRAEMHGQEPVPAVDIRFALVGSNMLLNMFESSLRPAFYKRAGNEDSDEPELEGVEPVSDMPELRVPSIKMPVNLNREYLGRILVIDYGLGGKSNIELASCDVGEFAIDCKDGGTVEIDFRVQAAGLDDKSLGKLGTLVKHDVRITLVSSPESAGTQESVPDTGSPFKFSVPPEGGIVDNTPQPDATDQFITANAKPAAKKSAKKAPDPVREAEKAKRFPAAAKKKPTGKK